MFTMKKSELLENLQTAYNAVMGNPGPRFNGSEIQSQAFTSLLEQALNDEPKYVFTVQNQGESRATFICPCHDDGGVPFIPSKRDGDKVTVLLHWGMNYKFLDDLSSWGHERCSYKIDDVDYSAIEEFKREYESNYWMLHDAFVQYKETGEWFIPGSEE